MGFAAWWLNLDSVGPPAPPPPPSVPVETPRILGTIIQTRGNPQLRYLDNRRLRRQRQRQRTGLIVKRTINVKQFAYNLNKEFNRKLLLKYNIVRANRGVDNFIKTLNVNEEPSLVEQAEILIKINMNAPKFKIINRAPIKIIMKEPMPSKKKKGFDFDKFLEYTPNMKSKHRFLQ